MSKCIKIFKVVLLALLQQYINIWTLFYLYSVISESLCNVYWKLKFLLLFIYILTIQPCQNVYRRFGGFSLPHPPIFVLVLGDSSLVREGPQNVCIAIWRSRRQDHWHLRRTTPISAPVTVSKYFLFQKNITFWMQKCFLSPFRERSFKKNHKSKKQSRLPNPISKLAPDPCTDTALDFGPVAVVYSAPQTYLLVHDISLLRYNVSKWMFCGCRI